MVRPIKYRPGKKVKIKRGLFAGEIKELDDIIKQDKKVYYKLKGSSHFWKPSEVKLIKGRKK